jgi:hypothetical protein
VATTPNSVRAVTKTTGLADNEFYHPAWGGTFVQPQNTLPEAVKNLLELYGVCVPLTGKAIVGGVDRQLQRGRDPSCMHRCAVRTIFSSLALPTISKC